MPRASNSELPGRMSKSRATRWRSPERSASSSSRLDPESVRITAAPQSVAGPLARRETWDLDWSPNPVRQSESRLVFGIAGNGTPIGIGSAESKGRKGGTCDASARRSLAVRGYINIYWALVSDPGSGFD